MNDLDAHLDAILQGDARAFGRWMVGAEPTIRLSLKSFAASVDTEAVLQETLLRVWTVAPRFVRDGRPNGLLRLGIRIARNLAVSETRKLRTSPVDSDDLERLLAGLGTEGMRGPDPFLREAIARCREKLPEKPAAALQARLEAAGGEHDVDIAARLGVRKNTFLQNFSRARKFLAKCLEDQGVDLEAELA